MISACIEEVPVNLCNDSVHPSAAQGGQRHCLSCDKGLERSSRLLEKP